MNLDAKISQFARKRKKTPKQQTTQNQTPFILSSHRFSFLSSSRSLRTSSPLSLSGTTRTRKMATGSLRVVVKSGWLTKEGRIIKSWRVRWFVLKDKKLYYYKVSKKHKKKKRNETK
jgi:hypothetical protein